MPDKEVVFEQFRLKYPGGKAGFRVEYTNFIYRANHPKPGKPKFKVSEVLPLLMPAVEAQIKWRQDMSRWWAEWKRLETWINNLCWEEEPPQKAQVVEHKQKCFVCKTETERVINTAYGSSPICDVCRTLLASAPLTFTWKGQKISKISLDKGQLEAMILKQKAKR